MLYLKSLINVKEGKGKEGAGEVKANKRRGRAGRNRTESEGGRKRRREKRVSKKCEAP